MWTYLFSIFAWHIKLKTKSKYVFEVTRIKNYYFCNFIILCITLFRMPVFIKMFFSYNACFKRSKTDLKNECLTIIRSTKIFCMILPVRYCFEITFYFTAKMEIKYKKMQNSSLCLVILFLCSVIQFVFWNICGISYTVQNLITF